MSVKHKKTSDSHFIPRLTIKPYLAYPIILLFIIILWTPYVLQTHDWSPILYTILGSLIFLDLIRVSVRYRIWWQDDNIFQRSADKIMTSISVNDITQIKRESSDFNTLLSLRRPSRRITLYGETSEGSKVIDISLIHFKQEDIKKMMKMIHEKRPDLEMPKGWI